MGVSRYTHTESLSLSLSVHIYIYIQYTYIYIHKYIHTYIYIYIDIDPDIFDVWQVLMKLWFLCSHLTIWILYQKGNTHVHRQWNQTMVALKRVSGFQKTNPDRSKPFVCPWLQISLNIREIIPDQVTSIDQSSGSLIHGVFESGWVSFICRKGNRVSKCEGIPHAAVERTCFYADFGLRWRLTPQESWKMFLKAPAGTWQSARNYGGRTNAKNRCPWLVDTLQESQAVWQPRTSRIKKTCIPGQDTGHIY